MNETYFAVSTFNISPKVLEVTERKNIIESKKKCSFSVIKDIASVGKSYLFFSYKTINDKLMYIPNDDET